ncbi:MAG TPA: hypothetical protein VKZ79_01845, partial [Alphaproteobacteria bacterium]|nr:hypothetical protein [Alphaproteobacteria bacterium]
AVDIPASCSRRIPMICSSLNRLPLIVRPSIRGRTLLKSGGDPGAQVTAYALKDRLPEARAALAEFLKGSTTIKTIADLRAEPSSTDPTFLAQRERLIEGLRRAGMAEG